MNFTNCSIFRLWDRIMRVWDVIGNRVKMSGHHLSIINWSWNNNVHNILWPLSLAQFLSLSLKIVKFAKFMPQNFWNWESTYDPTDVLDLICDRETTARPFDTIYDLYRPISSQRAKSANLVSAGTNAYEIVGNRRVKVSERKTLKFLLISLADPKVSDRASVRLLWVREFDVQSC